MDRKPLCSPLKSWRRWPGRGKMFLSLQVGWIDDFSESLQNIKQKHLHSMKKIPVFQEVHNKQIKTKYYQIQFCQFLVQGHILEHVRHLVSGCYFWITTWKSSFSTCTVLPVTFIRWHSLNYQRVRLPNANFPNALTFLKICLNFCTIYNFCEMIHRKPVIKYPLLVA